MKIFKWALMLLSFLAFSLIALNTLFANKHLLNSYSAGDYFRYLFFFPGITLCLYLAFSLYKASMWSHFFVAVFLCLPALIAVHFVVSVMNAHTGGAYWWWQVLEIAVTYLAWSRTGKRWSKSLLSDRAKHSANGIS
ncbi:hypothetical protein FHR56_003664 [Xanthomonas sacchari]|uniref:hypothetical protein n=1 Tax=unclassified Xanthomonas TaxID=2643310 RepID=UPI00136812E0|nr:MULTISPECIES: hypothetical protein [unclassified Xanthomonas]MBB6368485.1 hypothetical protein [Xanthomonas sp. F10]